MSSPTAPGYFRDRANIPAANLLPLPSNIGYDEATLYEPISIVLHSFRFADPKLGEDVVVFGAGPIGLSTIACLKLAGVRRIWAVEPVAYRRELALQLGADEAIDPHATDPVAEIRKDTGRGAHLVIDCATKEDTINQSLRAARPGGRVCITGVPAGLRVPFEFHTMRSKELAFFTVRRSNHVSGNAIDLLAAEARRFTPMLSHRMPMDRIQSAFETLEAYRDGANKIVLHP
jgi:L-iditol 2-dehydrogenase